MKILTILLTLTMFLFLPIYAEAQLGSAMHLRQHINSYKQATLSFAFKDKALSTSLHTLNFQEGNTLKPERHLYALKPLSSLTSSNNNLSLSLKNNKNMISNKRLKYSSLWAFASLNYLYADLVGLMDLNLLNQYQIGVVNGVEITPEFLTAAAAYMQIPLANVFLPHVIKNDSALRWVQIISGSIATLVQGATLFVGTPTPYYILFSAIEIGATAFITIDALKWKVGKNKR